MTYDCHGPFPLQFFIIIIEIWHLTAGAHFLYNPLPKSMKYNTSLLGTISFTTPYQNHWNMTSDCSGHFLYNSVSKSLKYDTRLIGAVSFTFHYQNHWNVIYDCYGQFPLQLLVKIVEIWYHTAKSNFLHSSLSKSLKDNLWLLGAISSTTPYQNHWKTYDCYRSFPIQFLVKIIEIWHWTDRGSFVYISFSKSLKYDVWLLWAICLQFLININEIWYLAARGNFLYNSVSKSLTYYLWLIWVISFTIPYRNHWNVIYDCLGQFLSPYQNHWNMKGHVLYISLSKSMKYDA